MTLGWVVAGGVVLIVYAAWRAWRRVQSWAAQMRDLGVAFVQVQVLPPQRDHQSYDVTLHSTKPHPIRSLKIPLGGLEATGLEPPDGFARSVALEAEYDDGQERPRVWAPVAPMALIPGETRRFTLRFRPDVHERTLATMTLTVPLSVGGGIVPVNLPVPLRDPRAIALWNERTDLRLKAHLLGVMPNTLPGWEAMRAREEALRADSGDAL